VSEKIFHSRRRFLRASAMGVAATQRILSDGRGEKTSSNVFTSLSANQ
jgi:hypothetical protein